jgi:hypothetical protein
MCYAEGELEQAVSDEQANDFHSVGSAGAERADRMQWYRAGAQ